MKCLRFCWIAAALCAWVTLPAEGTVRITEFAASNLRGIVDEDGDHEDWIELFNDGTNAVPLGGWYLTDKSSDFTKWRFPPTNIGPGKFLVVFASGKDRRTPGLPLHTNFKLDAGGEFLALVEADGATVAAQFAPVYPPQVTDISYGFASEARRTVLAQGAAVAWKVWTTNTLYTNESPGWNSSLSYSAAGWSNATSGLGWDDQLGLINFTGYFGSNSSPRSLMSGQARSLFARFKPVITNFAGASEVRLRLKFDDGMIAWLNGQPMATNLAPSNPSWNSLATANRDDSLNAAWAVFRCSSSLLVNGTNLLAFQAFNSATNSPELLLLPELDLIFPVPATNASYLFTSTPGATNSSALTVVPPTVEMPPPPPRPPGGPGSPSITITALVTRTLAPITNVALIYRAMFNTEVSVPMSSATGGVCTASVPTSGLNPGELLRWRVEARDASNNIGTGPLFLDANDDDRYHGTVALNSAETNSRLTVLHWFLNNYSAAITENGGRGSFFFLDRFYDNVLVKLHGQSTGGFPKKGHDLDFNAGNRFVWREGELDAKDVNLLTDWADKSKVRNTMAYEMFARAGVLGHWAFPVRVQTNGVFFAIHDLVEDGDDRFTERVGLDPDGALYKVYTAGYPGGISSTNTWSAEKKSRKYEGNADLAAFSAGVATNWTFAQRRSYVYDNVDIAATANYLAALVVTSCKDQGHKNFYLYRDSNHTRQWRVLPWDVDLTLGHDWVSQYFDDQIRTNQTLQLGTVNNLKSVIFNSPELNQLFLRRVRTLMDTVLQPLATPTSQLTNETRIQELLDLMDPPDVEVSDADLDFQKWGWWTNSTRYTWANPEQEMRPQAQRILDTFYPGRRAFLETCNPLSSGAPIPPSQPASVAVAVAVGDFNPAGGRQDQEYVILRNTNLFAVDISGWSLSSAIDYVFPPGTVIPSGSGATQNIGLLFVASSPYAFRQRSSGPGSNQFCLVSGPYSGQLSARGETLVLRDPSGQVVASTTYPGAPSAAQQFLRITEIMYNPPPMGGSTNGAQEFEFLELRNLSQWESLELQGVSFGNGLVFCFTNSSLLGPQQRIVLAKNPAAFTARYGGGVAVTGPYEGYLDNGGERLTLLDSNNEEILDFSYHNKWHPITDGLGFSLVVVDELAEPDAWGSKTNWRPSGVLQGSPGEADALPVWAPVKINEALTHTDLPQVDTIELFNPTTNAVEIGGWFLTDDFFAPFKYRVPEGTTLPALGYALFDEYDFNNQADTNLNFRLSSTGDDLWLFGADANTNLTGYVHGFTFGAAANGVSFGRYATSDGREDFVVQRALTLGEPNAGPLVGPVIIRSVMYHPPDLDSNGVPTADALNEFVELFNQATTNVPLFRPDSPTNTWRLRGPADFSFPDGLTLPAGGSLLLTGLSPTNASQLAAFRARWALSTNTAVLGPWNGKLDNGDGDVKLERPDSPDLDGTVPYILVDRVHYSDHSPWPAAADGFGAALQRVSDTAYGDDPTNWLASAPLGASVPDTDGDGMPDWWEVVHGLDRLGPDAALDADGDGLTNLQEFLARTDPQNAASVFRLIAWEAGQGSLVILFDAAAGLSYSLEASEDLAPGSWTQVRVIDPAPTNRCISLTRTSTTPQVLFYRLVTPP